MPSIVFAAASGFADAAGAPCAGGAKAVAANGDATPTIVCLFTAAGAAPPARGETAGCAALGASSSVLAPEGTACVAPQWPQKRAPSASAPRTSHKRSPA